jgi:hypothetical protein
MASSVPPNSSRATEIRLPFPEKYAAISDAQTVTSGFFDSNQANQIDKLGVMAHVYSTFESRAGLKGPNPTAHGIKSFLWTADAITYPGIDIRCSFLSADTQGLSHRPPTLRADY